MRKKIIYLLLLLVSCQKDNVTPTNITNVGQTVTVKHNDLYYEYSDAVFYTMDGQFHEISPVGDTVGQMQPLNGWLDVDTTKPFIINVYNPYTTPQNYKIYIGNTLIHECYCNDFQYKWK